MNALGKIHPFEACVLAALFSIAICLPLAKQLTVGEPNISPGEKRLLAPFPDLSLRGKPLVKFLPTQITDYYRDHFGFRHLLLRTYSLLYYKLLNMSHWAVLGEHGWFFYKNYPSFFSQSLSDSDLATWKGYLEARQRWLAARGIKYLLVVPPDKDSVYQEFLPATSRSRPAVMPVDQLVRYLKETHSTVDVLYLREPLLAAKTQEQEPLFCKQDGHWNSLGAFYGYQAIMQQLAVSFPALKAKSRADYRLEFAPDNRRDIAMQAGLADDPPPEEPVLQLLTPALSQTEQMPLPDFKITPTMARMPAPSTLPRVVMLRDSFATALAPYLSESFSQIIYFWPSLRARISVEQEKAIADIVLKEKADIFIEEHVERFLPALPDETITFGGAENTSPAANP